MNSTMEKMADEKSNTMGNQFFGEISHDDPKECAVMGLIKNQIHDLEEHLESAKIKFANATLDKDNWSMAKECEIACKVIDGQINILSKLQHDFECMLTPIPMAV